MKSLLVSWCAIALLLGLCCGPRLASAATADVSYPFRGVVHYHYQSLLPRQVDIHLLEVDLTDPAIDFAVGPKGWEDRRKQRNEVHCQASIL